jgi:Leucine-rich repeat (LRR) protein
MKKTFLLLLFLPLLSVGQFTYIPDDNFEQELINLGYDFVLDDNIETMAIDTVSSLYINSLGISDLTGIASFISLKDLFCHSNQLLFLNLSNNTQLFEVSCGSNQLTYIDVRNGNNSGLWYFNSLNNPSLTCIDVNDVATAEYNWATDSWTNFSTNCNTTEIEGYSSQRKLIKVLDVFGRSIIPKPNMPLLYIYDDGTTEKKLIIN